MCTGITEYPCGEIDVNSFLRPKVKIHLKKSQTIKFIEENIREIFYNQWLGKDSLDIKP